MRVLFVSWAWPSHVRPLVPLAWAFRAAGHDVRYATQPSQLGTITGAGLPAVAIGTAPDPEEAARAIRPLSAARSEPKRKRLGLSVALAEDMAGDLETFCREWQPDLVLYEPTTYAAPLIATKLGLPHVRVLWGVDFHSPARAFEQMAFEELCAKLGIDGFDSAGTLTLDPCPPSLQVGVPGRVLRTKYVPYNGTGTVPSWLWTEPERRRVVLTWGVSTHWAGEDLWADTVKRVRGIVDAVAGLDVELIAAVPTAELLGGKRLPDNVRVVQNLPLHVFLPSCDALISRGGAGSMMTGVVSGVTQVIVPEYVTDIVPAERMKATGAGTMVPDDDEDPAAVLAALGYVLGDPAVADAAERLKAEAEAQPGLTEVVAELVTVASGR